MELKKKRSLGDIVVGFWLLAHVEPIILILAVVTLFAVRATWPHPPWTTILLLLAGQAAMQFSIGILNDYFDRQRDVLSGKNKPIVMGLIRPQEALVAGLLMIVIMLIILAPLNFLALLAALGYLALGQIYNLGLKTTPLSGILFALAMPLLPLYAFAGVGRIPSMVIWFLPIGAILGVALNLANSLPDIEEDRAGGARSLAVTFGVKGSFIACPLLIALAAILIGTLTIFQLVPAQLWLMLPILVLTVLGLVSLLIFFGPARSRRTRKIYFYLVALLCLLLAGGWFIALKLS
ncbi:MAG TPA: UbiA family prenyltransferase [Ktedonobacteraceae bacterium]|nr:UbiA family prenyltransferase [Ktedonobacteraceae bacterium]